MKGYAVVCAVAIGVTLLTTPLVRFFVVRFGAVVKPSDARHVHTEPLPTLGGAAMFLGFLAAIAVASHMAQFRGMFQDNSEPAGLLLGAGAMFLVGALDDVIDVSPPAKLAGQVLAASLLAISGITMFFFRMPFNMFHTDVVVLSSDIAAVVTVLWVVLMTNAINLIDGLDGLAAGIVALAGAALFLFADRLFHAHYLDGSNIAPLVAIILVGGLDAFEGTVLQRYLHHPIERVEIVVFCCALGALAAKFVNGRAQRRALAMPLLPPWDGRPQPPAEASTLLAELSRRPSWLQNAWVGRRTTAILDFVCRRRSAADLDDHLRGLSDSDAVALEGSYALVRFLVWSLPILGFIGTVLGIAKSIAGVTPDVLEKSISSVTEGLALAFDTTGLGLMLTMVVMLLIYLAERREQAVLEEVDPTTEAEDREVDLRVLRVDVDLLPVLVEQGVLHPVAHL